MDEQARVGQQDTGGGPDTSGYLTYLRTNRDFTAPAVAAAIRSIEVDEPDRPLRVLDAGTGAGGALRELAAWVRATGPSGQGTVTAIDVDERAVEAARSELDPDVAELIDIQVADLHEVASQAASTGNRFDLIWSSDVVWPATFDDPAAVVRALTGALTPGGVLALFTTNYYQSMMLPGHSRVERLIRTASELTWGLPADGATHYERLGAWMREAGLGDVRPTAFPLAALTDADPAARVYMETIVWPEMRHAVASHGREAGMNDADVARAEELLNPTSPSWIGADPDTYVLQPTLLWTGHGPA